MFLRGVGFVLFAAKPTPEAACLASTALGLGTSIDEAGAYGVIGAQPAEARRRLIIANTQGLNVGAVLGPLAGAALSLFALWWPIAMAGA